MFTNHANGTERHSRPLHECHLLDCSTCLEVGPHSLKNMYNFSICIEYYLTPSYKSNNFSCKFVFCSGEDRRVRVWDLSAGTLLKDLRGHTDTVYALSFNRDSTMLASGGLDCMLRVWDIRKNVSSNTTT